MFFRNFFRLRQQQPTVTPPSGYKDLRLNKTTGRLVLVDSDGTETVFALTSDANGAIVSADISDATTDGTANPGKVLKTDANGNVSFGNSGGAYLTFSESDPVGSYYLRLVGLPTSDPSSGGALWDDSGTLKISQV